MNLTKNNIGISYHTANGYLETHQTNNTSLFFLKVLAEILSFIYRVHKLNSSKHHFIHTLTTYKYLTNQNYSETQIISKQICIIMANINCVIIC